MITLEQLNLIMPSARKTGRSDKFYPYLVKYLQTSYITNKIRQACFLSTIALESDELHWTRELWGPTADQISYDGRMGNIHPGDGKKYRGGGLIQTTGFNNYLRLQQKTGIQCVANPDLLSEPDGAVHSAVFYWLDNDLNNIADYKGFLAVSRAVNIGDPDSRVLPHGWKQRNRYYQLCISIIPDDPTNPVVEKPDFSNVQAGSTSTNVRS